MKRSAAVLFSIFHLLICAKSQLVINDVTFYAYTRNNTEDPLNLTTISLNPPPSTIMIVHGWSENASRPWCTLLKNEFFKKGNADLIIITDWSKKSKTNYFEAQSSLRQIAATIAGFLVQNKLQTTTHIVGHSLGSHLAGFTGKFIYSSSGDKLERITALDPAGPLFELPFVGPDGRLSRDDAEFVDVVHSDGGGFGFNAPLGQVDFYPNGGKSTQPGCPRMPMNLKELFCSHQKSVSYFIETINSARKAKRCSSWEEYQNGSCNFNEEIPFGEDTWRNVTGNFYLKIESSIVFN